GPFGITELDALRLRRGLAGLEAADPVRAARVRIRAAEYIATIGPQYPGNSETGELYGEDALPQSMDDVPCPALDPHTGWCDLYEARPIICRTFGPVTRIGQDTFGACELCYNGATDEDMAACAVDIDCQDLENELLSVLDAKGMTIVAYAICR